MDIKPRASLFNLADMLVTILCAAVYCYIYIDRPWLFDEQPLMRNFLICFFLLGATINSVFSGKINRRFAVGKLAFLLQSGVVYQTCIYFSPKVYDTNDPAKLTRLNIQAVVFCCIILFNTALIFYQLRAEESQRKQKIIALLFKYADIAGVVCIYALLLLCYSNNGATAEGYNKKFGWDNFVDNAFYALFYQLISFISKRYTYFNKRIRERSLYGMGISVFIGLLCFGGLLMWIETCYYLLIVDLYILSLIYLSVTIADAVRVSRE